MYNMNILSNRARDVVQLKIESGFYTKIYRHAHVQKAVNEGGATTNARGYDGTKIVGKCALAVMYIASFVEKRFCFRYYDDGNETVCIFLQE